MIPAPESPGLGESRSVLQRRGVESRSEMLMQLQELEEQVQRVVQQQAEVKEQLQLSMRSGCAGSNISHVETLTDWVAE